MNAILFTGYLTVEKKGAGDVRGEACRFLEKTTLDGRPVLGLHISCDSSLHAHPHPFYHQQPCACEGIQAVEYEAAVIIAGDSHDREDLMFKRFAFRVEGFRCELFLGGAIAYSSDGERENLVGLNDRNTCPFPGQFSLF